MKRLCLLLLLITYLVTSCSPVSVVYKDERKGDFSRYRTFDFKDFSVDNQTVVPTRPDAVDYLQSAIQRELVTKGFKKVEQSPDLLVNIGVVITQEVTTRTTDIRDAPVYMGTRNYHWESEEVVVNQYREGTVLIDLIDARQNELVWEGSAKSILSKKPDKMEKRIDEALAKLFKDF